MSVPKYIARLEEWGGGFRCVVTCDGETLHQGEARPDREAARKDAALFVILRPEEQRTLVWAEDEPVWRGDQQVGWLSVEAPLQGSVQAYGFFRPTPALEPYRRLFESAIERWLAFAAHEYAAIQEARPIAEPLADADLKTYQAACEVVAALGLSIGAPPQPIGDLELSGQVAGDWYLTVFPVDVDGRFGRHSAEPGAAADGGS